MGEKKKILFFFESWQHFFKYVKGAYPFFLGLALALLFGWFGFPNLMLKGEEQPVLFSHGTHLNNGLECSFCHHLRPDGSFSKFPTTKECAVCHRERLGNSAEEKVFFEEYISKNKEVAWLAYQKQPDNVFFPHAAHTLRACNECHEYSEKELCSLCHINMSNEKYPLRTRKNRLTGYTTDTMKMWKCEECHANPSHIDATNASNACFVCHK